MKRASTERADGLESFIKNSKKRYPVTRRVSVVDPKLLNTNQSESLCLIEETSGEKRRKSLYADHLWIRWHGEDICM